MSKCSATSAVNGMTTKLKEREKMSNYTPEIEYDDMVDNCDCCTINLEILEGERE